MKTKEYNLYDIHFGKIGLFRLRTTSAQFNRVNNISHKKFQFFLKKDYFDIHLITELLKSYLWITKENTFEINRGKNETSVLYKNKVISKITDDGENYIFQVEANYINTTSIIRFLKKHNITYKIVVTSTKNIDVFSLSDLRNKRVDLYSMKCKSNIGG